MFCAVPASYRWLYNEMSPRILVSALAEIGTVEYKGADNNPKIISWAQELGSSVGIDYSHDSIPWCGLFMGICAKRAGYAPPNICVRAKEWLKFGQEVFVPMLGDIMILNRRGGGHVGIYIGEGFDDGQYHILGGNQSDAVNIRTFDKKNILGIRRCSWRVGQPPNVRPIILANNGVPSLSEA